VDDLATLEADAGIALYLGQIRRALGLGSRRMARGGAGVLPSLTSVREWLDGFHQAAEEEKRRAGVAFIPAPNAALACLRTAGRQFVTAA